LWQNGRKICTDLYTIRKNIYPSFLRRRMVGGGTTSSRWNLGSTCACAVLFTLFSAQFLVNFFRNGGDRGLRVRVIILLRQNGYDVCLWRVDRLFVTSWLCDELTVWRVDCHPPPPSPALLLQVAQCVTWCLLL